MAYRVHILETDEAFVVEPDESVLDAAVRAAVKLPHECTFGGCGTCRIKLKSGAVRYDEFPMALTPEEAADGYALACQARPESDLCSWRGSGNCCRPPCTALRRTRTTSFI
jgi:CDP-4-dehydro-6-deoxyglucose reductase